MTCPFPRLIVNPTWLKQYPEYAKKYYNESGEHLYSALSVQDIVDKLKIDFSVPPTLSVPCGKCMICKSNKQQEWIFRLKQEMDMALGCHFVTVTYDDLHLPFIDSVGKIHRLADEVIYNDNAYPTLLKSDLQKFLKRLRWNCEPLKLRYFAVGEYGGINKRPHYHILLFGLPSLSHNFDPMKIIHDSWQMGQVDIGTITGKSINYVTSYITFDKEAPYHYSQPVFVVMSRRPGIGSNFIDSEERKRFYDTQSLKDNNAVCSHDGVRMPLPRYYKNKFYTDDDRLAAMVHSHEIASTTPSTDYELHKQETKRNQSIITNQLLKERAEKRKKHVR